MYRDTTVQLKVARFAVSIDWPDTSSPVGTLLVLPGWSFSKDDWCQKGTLCREALRRGYILVRPEMGKSNYQVQHYPETRADLRGYPTRRWLTDTLFQQLNRKFGLFPAGGRSFVVGLSTGARGAAAVCLALPSVFKAGACLSGDYDPTTIPNDRVHIATLGTYMFQRRRWASEPENLQAQAARFRTPLYLAHGQADRVCSVGQTQLFHEALRKAVPDLRVQCTLEPDGDHSYTYWDRHTIPLLDFFESIP